MAAEAADRICDFSLSVHLPVSLRLQLRHRLLGRRMGGALLVWQMNLGSSPMPCDNAYVGVHAMTELLPPAEKKLCKAARDWMAPYQSVNFSDVRMIDFV